MSVWPRNYHERIIRDENELDRIRRYLVDNPARWASDPENPDVVVRAGLRGRQIAQGRPGQMGDRAGPDQGRDESRPYTGWPTAEPTPRR